MTQKSSSRGVIPRGGFRNRHYSLGLEYSSVKCYKYFPVPNQFSRCAFEIKAMAYWSVLNRGWNS